MSHHRTFSWWYPTVLLFFFPDKNFCAFSLFFHATFYPLCIAYKIFYAFVFPATRNFFISAAYTNVGQKNPKNNFTLFPFYPGHTITTYYYILCSILYTRTNDDIIVLLLLFVFHCARSRINNAPLTRHRYLTSVTTIRIIIIVTLHKTSGFIYLFNFSSSSRHSGVLELNAQGHWPERIEVKKELQETARGEWKKSFYLIPRAF